MTAYSELALPRTAPALLAAGLVVTAALLGLCVGVFGAGIGFLAVAALLPLLIILRDYRAGVLVLTMLLPVTPMLPQVKGLNPLNIVTILTLGSLFLREAFATRRLVSLPRSLWLCLVLPATWGIAIAWPHIPEGVRNYPELVDASSLYEPWSYATARYAKPLFYYLSYAFLLSNAVRHSERPDRFVLLLAAAMVLPSLAVFYTVGTYPGTLMDVSRDREFMAPRGLHANEFGMLLAAAAGPMLFLGGGAATGMRRWTCRAAFALVTLALLLTFSRGGLTSWLVAVLGYLLHHRRLKTFLISAFLTAVILVAAPESMKERFGTGLRANAIGDVSNIEKDDLTAGRVHGWMLLAPEVLDSPWFGRGLGSTQWSTAVAEGHYIANHPHNIYLEILMDLGLAGLCAIAWLWASHLRHLGRLARDTTLSSDMRMFFVGARWSFLGTLIMAATTAYYMPNTAQFPLWFCFGMALARPSSDTERNRPQEHRARPAGAAPLSRRVPVPGKSCRPAAPLN